MSSFPRSKPGTLRPHDVSNAVCAALTARSMSALVPSAILAIGLPVDGFKTLRVKVELYQSDATVWLCGSQTAVRGTHSMVLPSAPSTHLPPMKRPVLNLTLPEKDWVWNSCSKNGI